MESTIMNLEKDARKGESVVQYAIESLESNGETLVLKRCRKKLNPRKTLILDVRRSRTRELLLQNIHGLHNSIPKHITTIDEKYILRCLESIRNCALRAAAWNFTSNVDHLPDDVKSSNNMDRLAIEYPLAGKTDLIMKSFGEWTISTVSNSQTMFNILKNPLLQQFGKTDFVDVSQPFQESSITSSLQKEVKFLDGKYVSAPMHKRDASISSTNSSCSDQSSSSSSSYGTSFQGMLQCTWKNGLPRHVFTVDDKREIYIANLSKVESLDGKGLDYVYTFHSSSNGKKECDIHELELESVAKMCVSTSIKFSSNNSKVKETRFILSVSGENLTAEIETSKHALTKNKKLTRKVVDIFKSTHLYKQRSSAIFEDNHNICVDSGEGCGENNYAPNLELAAIVVKEICNNRKEDEFGGWGLKFLKRPSIKRSECSGNNEECSTSMAVIIPAGFHGGPRTRVGGPSTLTERWISGGRCDCGGWDIGCPLTILKSNTDYSSQADDSRECISVDLFTQGSKQNAPIMKLVNFHKGLYYIHFQSTLSSLQSFAIAAAIIHSHSPVLRSKVYRS
ncbi:hypothetical protein DH2020_043462 [Rehmannia glutinosa]|uniref:Uncharacterized protein n=1 Tax=Rehmannia glutinosa TaxID=99300 RepID=A0ABR0UKU7_REHGL